jgi:hypothetical protein
MSAADHTRHSPLGEFLAGVGPVIVMRTTERGRPHSDTLIELSDRLQPRDYAIAALLDEHTTLTTEQVSAVLFDNTITCRHRLHLLRRLAFIDRFVRYRTETGTPICWVHGLLSARFMALAHGERPPTPRAVRERQDRIYSSPTLDHQLETNQVFVNLLAHSRRHPETALTRWWSARTTAGTFGQRIHPDGHGVWAHPGGSVGFHLELDRGTEPLQRVADKLGPYRRLQAAGGPPYPVLFVLPTRSREQNLHRRLVDRHDPELTVATTSPEAGTDPAGPVWRVVGNGARRLALADLGAGHGEPGPLNPGPPNADEHPLRLLSA